IELGPLLQDDAVALAEQLAPNLDQDGADRLWEASGGSPFWLEVLAHGLEEGARTQHAVAERLRLVDPDGGTVLAALAVAARPLMPSDLAGLLDWPISHLESAVRGLLDRALASQLAEREVAYSEWLRVSNEDPDPMIRVRATLSAGREAYELGRLSEAREAIREVRSANPLRLAYQIAVDSLEASVKLWLEHKTREGRELAYATVDLARSQ